MMRFYFLNSIEGSRLFVDKLLSVAILLLLVFLYIIIHKFYEKSRGLYSYFYIFIIIFYYKYIKKQWC